MIINFTVVLSYKTIKINVEQAEKQLQQKYEICILKILFKIILNYEKALHSTTVEYTEIVLL